MCFYPVQERCFICAVIGNGDKHICQFAGFQLQVVAIPLEKQLHHHCADPLVAIGKGVVGCESVSKACDFFNFGGEQIVSVKRLKRRGDGGFQAGSIPKPRRTTRDLDDAAVDQDDVLCFDPDHSAILS